MTPDVSAASSLPSWVSLVVVVFVTVRIGYGAVIGLLRARRRDRLAREAEASVSDKPPVLEEGRDVVLSGIVHHCEDQNVAVKVTVRQHGSEAESSGTWSHSWVEIDREIYLAPFLLELADGQTVEVHPPKNVDVADALDQKVWIDRNYRELSAELIPGEHIFARGRLTRSDRAKPAAAYRDVGWGWALGPSEGQMLLSSEPMGHGLRSRAAFHRFYGWLAVALLIASQLSFAWFYGRLLGPTELATVTGKNSYTSTNDDDEVTVHYEVTVRGESIEIDEGDYARIQRGTKLPIRGTGHNWELGSGATIAWYHALVLIVITLGYSTLYYLRRQTSRPWFRRKVIQSGNSGRLPDPPRDQVAAAAAAARKKS